MARRDPTAPPLLGAMRYEALAGRAMSALSERLQVRLGGGRPVVIDGQTLDPACQLTLAMMEKRGMGKSFGTVAQERALLSRSAVVASGTPDPVASVANIEIDGAQGTIKARHYRTPEAGGPHPLLVFYHGGGFVLGDLDSHDAPCRTLCAHAGVDVLSVDYRLAPEHQFPASTEDAIAAYRWALGNAADLGSDPTRVLVGGDSAGGNLAAVTARETAKSLTPPPFAQLLIYPVTDMVARVPGSTEPNTRSYELFGEGFLLTTELMDWFGSHYVKVIDHVDPSDPRISPLRAESHDGLPQALVITAGFDPLRDEGEAYATALSQAGGRVVTRRFEGLIHGFINMGGVSKMAREALIEMAGMLRSITHAT